MKNALDWVVSSRELAGKPVALFNPSARGTYAQASLVETLAAMATILVPEAAFTFKGLVQPISEQLILQDRGMSATLLNPLEVLSRSGPA